MFVEKNANRADGFEVVILWLGNTRVFFSHFISDLSLYILIILTGIERFGDSCL